MPSADELRAALVAELEKGGAIRSPAVRDAFLTVPRERFIPEVTETKEVYADEAHVIRRSPRGMPTSSSSQPRIMAEMLERLDLRPGLRVLEIGAGTGYNAALLALIVGPGQVTSIELEPELAERAAAALDGYGVEVVAGDARAGAVAGGPFDRIVLTANADTVERVWLEQLAEGGLIELPLRMIGTGNTIGEQAVVTFRRNGDRLQSVSTVMGGFMPLRAPGDSSHDEPPNHLSFSEFVGGTGRNLASLTGEDLASMRPIARRHLAGLLVAQPRSVRRISTPASPWSSLVFYVALAEAPPGTVALRYSGGAALAGRNGRSLGLALSDRERRVRIERRGEAFAGEALDSVVERWQRAGRPTLEDLSVTVSYRGRPRRPAHGRVLPRPDSWLTLAWPE